jgi:hypothetical protein
MEMAASVNFWGMLEDVSVKGVLPDVAAFLKILAGISEILLRKRAAVIFGIDDKSGIIRHSADDV